MLHKFAQCSANRIRGIGLRRGSLPRNRKAAVKVRLGARPTATGTNTGECSDLSDDEKLPAPAKIVAEQQVGPTLGAASIHGGAMAFGVSFLVIFALMLRMF